MSQKRAKRIRKLVYGDLVTKAKYRYVMNRGGMQLLADNMRKKYQQAKKRLLSAINLVVWPHITN